MFDMYPVVSRMAYLIWSSRSSPCSYRAAEEAGQAENQDHDPDRTPDFLGLPDAAVSTQILGDLEIAVPPDHLVASRPTHPLVSSAPCGVPTNHRTASSAISRGTAWPPSNS
jgi:hypothetical protein